MEKEIIPIELEEFITDFSKSKDNMLQSRYLSNKRNYLIEYKDDIPTHRISVRTGDFEINRPDAIRQSKEFIYFVLCVLYLARHLDRTTDDKYSENLLRCDLIVFEMCKNKGFDMLNIYKDFEVMCRHKPTGLNIKRLQNFSSYIDNTTEFLTAD